MENSNPCPFCGGVNQYVDSAFIDAREEFFIVCRDCQAEGPTHVDEFMAAYRWNERAAL
jgi:Lar family restriction alleviation protein